MEKKHTIIINAPNTIIPAEMLQDLTILKYNFIWKGKREYKDRHSK